jgi:4-amino-4-deoxy-L-arabinose transferase-like glycosyltransferase
VRSEASRIAFLVVLSAVLAFSFQGSRGLYETTEGRYAESAREMLETGRWLVPQLDYKPHWAKPPFAYWAIAGGMRLLGENEWGVRLADAVAFVLVVLTMRALAALMWDRRTGLAAGTIYALSPFPLVAASSIHTDLLLSLWELLAVLCYWKAYRAMGTRSERGWIVGAWAFLGVAFLTKGPPSLVVLAAFIAFQIYLTATKRMAPRLFSPVGFLAMLAIGLGWFVLVVARTPGLFGFFLREEVFARVFTSKHGRNPEWYAPFTIYAPVLLFGAGPAMLVWPVELLKDRAARGWGALRRFLKEDERLAFAAIWLIVPLVIFSLAKSRLPFYVLPLFPAVVLPTSRLAVRTLARPGMARAAAVVMIVTTALLLLAKGWSAHYATDLDMRALYRVCTKAKKGPTRFFLYGRSDMYGLQFYLGGHLTRLADEPLPEWAREGLRSAVMEMKTRPTYETYVFIVDSRWRADALAKRLDELHVEYRTMESGGRYTLFVCRTPSESSSFAMAEGSLEAPPHPDSTP